MRQPLLGWQMVEAGELVADDWRHIWVVPDGNMKLLAANPSARSAGGSLGDACIGVLRQSARFSLLSPCELLAGVDPPEHWRDSRGWRAVACSTHLAGRSTSRDPALPLAERAFAVEGGGRL